MVIITIKLQCLKLLLFSISYSMLASSMFLNSIDLTILHFNQKFLQVNLAPKRLAQNISSSIIVRYLYYLRFHIDCEKALTSNPPPPPPPQKSLLQLRDQSRHPASTGLLPSLMCTYSSLHSRKELHMEFPTVLAVLKFKEEFLNMKKDDNQDDVAICIIIFFLHETVGFGLQ